MIVFALAIAFLFPHEYGEGNRELVANACAVAAPMVPVFESREVDVATCEVFAWRESRDRDLTGDHGKAHGYWQEWQDTSGKSAIEQALYWYDLLANGKQECPQSPAAPLSGSCLLARSLADRRVNEARAKVRVVLANHQD